MNYKTIILQLSSNVAVLTLNRPDKRNAMNGDMVAELRDALKTLAGNKAARVLVINGKGDHFCSGGDIQWMREMAGQSYDANKKDAQELADLMRELYLFPKPTIALAQGATLGGGLGLLCACDIAIAAEGASFGFSEVRLGIAPSTISPYVLAAIGSRKAHFYFLTGERFDVREALHIGLIHRVVNADNLYDAGIAVANLLLENSSQAMMAIKQLIRDVTNCDISTETAAMTAKHLADLRMSEDGKEGLKAFLDKRAPEWQ